MRTQPDIEAANLNAYHDPDADNTPPVITLAADADQAHVLDKIYAGYDDVAISGKLTITINAVTKFSCYVCGSQMIDVSGLHGLKNQAVVITLAAVASTKGTVFARYR